MFFGRFRPAARALALLIVSMVFAMSAVAAANPTYKGYIVVDAATGAVLLEDNADVVSPPASMTKLMTYAVLYDRLQSGALSLDTPVKIKADDAGMGGTQVHLDPRETFPVEELIHAMMIQSANDAAHALAQAAAGSREAFVEWMNAKARDLGMTRTTFRTPHGLTSKRQRLEEGDLTTPRDFARLCQHLVTKTDVLKYTSVRVREFAPDRPQGPMRMENHNKLLGKVAGVDGLKTGYTENAGYCLSATAERNGRRLVAVIMGCFGPNKQKDVGDSRDRKTTELLERAFAALPAATAKSVTSPVTPAAPASPISAPESSPASKPTKPASPIEAVDPAPPAAPATAEEKPAVKFVVPKTSPPKNTKQR